MREIGRIQAHSRRFLAFRRYNRDFLAGEALSSNTEPASPRIRACATLRFESLQAYLVLTFLAFDQVE